MRAARSGNVHEVRRIIRHKTRRDDGDNKYLFEYVNRAPKRVEVEEKHGYDKEWTWNRETHLISATKQGHVEVVKELLVTGLADPFIDHSLIDDVHQRASQCKIRGNREEILAMLSVAESVWKSRHYSAPLTLDEAEQLGSMIEEL